MALSFTKLQNWSKLKAFANDNLTVTQFLRFASSRLENLVGKRETRITIFLNFAQCPQNTSFSGW